MSNNRLLATAFTFTLIFGFATAAWAQNGSISGTVSDSTGAVIPAAQVSVHDVLTGAARTTATNSQGFYEFLAMKPSKYELMIEAKGFGRAVKHDINVVVGLESRLDLVLTPGPVSETIEVKTEIPLIEPEKTNVSYSVESQQIQNLPISSSEGRSWQSLYNFPLFVAQLIPPTDTTFATTRTSGIIHELNFAEVAANRASSEPVGRY